MWSKKETKYSLTHVASSLEFYLHGMSELGESRQFHFQRNFDVLQSSVWNNKVKNSG